MAPTQDLIPRFGIFKSIFNVCISFSGGRDSLVRIPALTHERPRIINLTHGSKDRAWVLAGGERLQRFYSLFTHSGQVSRVCGTNFSALILKFLLRVNKRLVLTDWWCSLCRGCRSRNPRSTCNDSLPAGLRQGLEALAPAIARFFLTLLKISLNVSLFFFSLLLTCSTLQIMGVSSSLLHFV